MFKTEIAIPSELIESQYNHVHHADALRMLEEARVRYLDDIGLPQSELLSMDCFLVLARCDVSFLRELKMGNVICTVAVEGEPSSSGFILCQEILKPPKRLAVRASIELVAMSGTTRRRRKIPEELAVKLRS